MKSCGSENKPTGEDNQPERPPPTMKRARSNPDLVANHATISVEASTVQEVASSNNRAPRLVLEIHLVPGLSGWAVEGFTYNFEDELDVNNEEPDNPAAYAQENATHVTPEVNRHALPRDNPPIEPQQYPEHLPAAHCDNGAPCLLASLTIEMNSRLSRLEQFFYHYLTVRGEDPPALASVAGASGMNSSPTTVIPSPHYTDNEDDIEAALEAELAAITAIRSDSEDPALQDWIGGGLRLGTSSSYLDPSDSFY